jgi:hydroxyacylglutathione hydrolase
VPAPKIAVSRHPRWLSNSYLVWDRSGGSAVVIDTGADPEPLERIVREERLDVALVLATHHHHDHVEHNDAWSTAHGCPVCAHADEALLLGGVTRELEHGEELVAGDLAIRVLHVPGHTTGQLAFLVDDTDLFTGDTLFRGSVGGTRASGHGTFRELRDSILGTLLVLPDATRIHPGHMGASTIGREREENPFVRAWTGRDRILERRCTAFGTPATLLLEAGDYDGGTKAWVRFDDGREDVVPGSRLGR